MRLYDKMLTDAPAEVRLNMRALAHETTVVAADAVAAHYADSPEMHWGREMYPHARPPWNHTFVEWNAPRTVRINGQIEESEAGQGGVFCVAKPCTRQARRDFNAMCDRMPSVFSDEANDTEKFSKTIADATVMVLAQPGTFIRGRLLVPDAKGFWFLNDDGLVLNWIMIGSSEIFHRMVRAADESGTSFGSEWFHIAWLTFTFANCRNVKLIDVTEEVQPEPKIRRRLKIPEVRRYCLEIGGHCVRPTREYDSTAEGVMPFHLCRGHFATYTADKPLFGNPKLVGRFWHPPHTRGKRENGEIIKDYSLAEVTSTPC